MKNTKKYSALILIICAFVFHSCSSITPTTTDPYLPLESLNWIIGSWENTDEEGTSITNVWERKQDDRIKVTTTLKMDGTQYFSSIYWIIVENNKLEVYDSQFNKSDISIEIKSKKVILYNNSKRPSINTYKLNKDNDLKCVIKNIGENKSKEVVIYKKK